MTAYQNFDKELTKLMNFYKSSLYAYDQTDYFLYKLRINKDELNKLEINADPPKFYKRKIKGAISDNQKNLTEIVFVRFVSALEVYLIEQVREIFLITKEPFRKENIIIEFKQSELLAAKSTADIFNKVIQKELRRLSSGGFSEIVKYYQKTLTIDISQIKPGKQIIEEYHQRRHLLVHRLGKTDQFYRDKYSYSGSDITVEKYYLEHCFDDFKEYASQIYLQVKDRLNTNFSSIKPKQKPEAKCRIDVEFSSKSTKIFDSNYEFLADDSICMFASIFDQKILLGLNKYSFHLSGNQIAVSSFVNIVKSEVKLGKIKAEINLKISGKDSNKPKDDLTEYLLDKIKLRLPEQPWKKNQHKRTAKELGLANKTVSRAITILIERQIFKPQINQKIIEINEN